MADQTALISLPTYQDFVDQNVALEPLGGPKDVFYYLTNFPEEIYQKSPDSHLYKYMRSILGEGGVNWLRKNHLEARILLEELGIDLFDLDKFFGNVFAFGRILEESFDDDPSIATKDISEQIKAKNARYRNRSLDFINGARAGNTPLGMQLAAKAGLGHNVEIVENYKYLYDVHSDRPLGLPYLGKTTSTEEIIVVPRRELNSTGVGDSVNEEYEISPKDQYDLQTALDRIRPQTAIMTVASGQGTRTLTNWQTMFATSEYTQVVRYVTGTSKIQWPNTSQTSWIVEQVEEESPRIAGDLQHHYTGFHNIASVESSTEFIGQHPSVDAIADYTEPLLVTSTTELQNGNAVSFINGIYPTSYQSLPGAPQIVYTDHQWESLGGTGEETLVINFPSLKAVNYLTFDIYKAPIQIDIEYDAYDENDVSLYIPVTPIQPYGNLITDEAGSQNPWASLGFSFSNSLGNNIFTRSLKIHFTRLESYTGSVQVKNLRAARSAA